MSQMTEQDIAAVLDRYPELTEHGMGVYEQVKKTPEDVVTERRASRRALLDSVEDCNHVCVWLADKVKIKTINHRHSSYSLKHLMEEQTYVYVTNGAFIVAAIHCGFRALVKPRWPNVCFNISQQSLRRRPRRTS